MPKGIPRAGRTPMRNPFIGAEMRSAREAPDLISPEEMNPFLAEEDEILPTVRIAGFACKWVRMSLEGKSDSKNMQTHLTGRLAYEYVRPDEPEVKHLAAMVDNRPGIGNVITVMDCVLMKVPEHLARLYQEAQDYKTSRQTSQIRADLADRFSKYDNSHLVIGSKVETERGVIFDEEAVP